MTACVLWRGRTTRFGRAIAVAMGSRLATGPARFPRPDGRGDVDTVFLGAFARAGFVALGGFRDFPSGAGEDADFFFRMRRGGGRVHLHPALRGEDRPGGPARGVVPPPFPSVPA